MPGICFFIFTINDSFTILFAIFSGSANQYVNIYSISRGNVNSIRYYEGFMGYRVGSISSLAFHPSRVVLATGTTDGTVNFYGLENRR